MNEGGDIRGSAGFQCYNAVVVDVAPTESPGAEHTQGSGLEIRTVTRHYDKHFSLSLIQYSSGHV